MIRVVAATLCGVALAAWSGGAAYGQGLQGLGDAVKKDANTAVQQEVQGATGKAMGKTGAAADTATGGAVKGATGDAGGAMKGGSDTGAGQGGGADEDEDDPE
jgi:hypothetical protein